MCSISLLVARAITTSAVRATACKAPQRRRYSRQRVLVGVVGALAPGRFISALPFGTLRSQPRNPEEASRGGESRSHDWLPDAQRGEVDSDALGRLVAFAVASLYVGVLSSYTRRAQIERLTQNRSRLATVLSDGAAALADIRAFYDGSAEADQVNFSSLIYALDITEHHLRLTMSHQAVVSMSSSDR